MAGLPAVEPGDIGVCAGRPTRLTGPFEWHKSLCASDIGPIRLAGGALIGHNAYAADLVTGRRRL